MLQSIPQEQRYDSIRLLQLLVYSNRPLFLAEAVDALAVDLTAKPYFDPRNRTPIPSEIIMSCSSLITIECIQEIHSYQEVLQLAHFSVQQYLKSEKVDPGWKHCMSEQYARVSNAKVCLAYCVQLQLFNLDYDRFFLEEIFPEGISDTPNAIDDLNEHPVNQKQFTAPGEAFDENTIDRPFTTAAAIQWTKYAVAVEDQDAELYAMIQDFLLSDELEQARRNWVLVRDRQLDSLIDPDWLEADVRPSPGDLDPLVIASLCGFYHTVESLLLCGADPNKFCSVLGSALYGALRRSYYDIVGLLLEHGARLNIKSGRAELSLAISCCSPTKLPELFHALLQHGADVDARDYRFGIPLVQAAKLGDENIVNTLLAKGADVNAVYKKHNAIQTAAGKGNNKIVRKLLKYKADVSSSGVTGASALYSACAGRHKEVVRTLLENGAIVCQQSDDFLYRNALEVACCGPDEEIVELLLEYAARDRDFDKRGSLGNCLSLACANGHERIVRLLLGHKANVNAQHDRVGTPLVAACVGGREQIVQLLLYHGTDVNQASATNRTGPLFRGTPLLHLINEASKEDTYGKHFSLLVPAWIRIFKMLIAAGADVNGSDDRDLTPLHLAAVSRSSEFLSILIEAGAFPNRHARFPTEAGAKNDIQDIDGRTMLHYAAMNEWLDLCTVLVKGGADTDLQDVDCKTALHLAASSGYSEICTMLVGVGADLDLLDSQGCTPLQLAEQGDHFEIVAFFRRFLQRKSALASVR